LICVDTGVVKKVDPEQMKLARRRASTAARGKFTMAVLGHPFYRRRQRPGEGYEDFAALKRLLRSNAMSPIVMAGRHTHDLEYYVETRAQKATVLHFVNGGGGAYLSFGTSLAWPPNRLLPIGLSIRIARRVTAKIQAETPWWKRPAWWWTRSYGAWPFSPEWLSAAFDYNVAPFFPELLEVRVERTTHRVVLRPYGVHGR
jgi:hypothetical protein